MAGVNTRPGAVIKHFKGSRYKVLHVGQMVTERIGTVYEKDVVILLSLADGEIMVMPKSQFKDLVVWPDDVTRSRFIVDDPESP